MPLSDVESDGCSFIYCNTETIDCSRPYKTFNGQQVDEMECYTTSKDLAPDDKPLIA